MRVVEKASIVLLQGYPGSGKSSVAHRLTRESIDSKYTILRHFSVGSHLRGILSGEIKSKHYKRILIESKRLVQSQRINDSLVNDVVHEYLTTMRGSELILIDGYPLYEKQIPMLTETVHLVKLGVLGMINIKINPETAVNRILNRGTRTKEGVASLEFARRRIMEHQRDCLSTTAVLSESFPSFTIDGELSPEEVLSEFKNVLSTLSILVT